MPEGKASNALKTLGVNIVEALENVCDDMEGDIYRWLRTGKNSLKFYTLNAKESWCMSAVR